MHLWEYNNYLIGYRSVIREREELIIKLAYNTAAFINTKQKPKPLEYYIQKIRHQFKPKTKSNAKVDVNKSKMIDRLFTRIESKGGE